jgi:Phosphotransferase enzyme family
VTDRTHEPSGPEVAALTVIDPAPASLTDVVSPEWLTNALGVIEQGARVVEARVVDDYTTVASKVRFEAVIEGPDGRRLSRSYCVKAGFAEGQVLNLVAESRFYQELGPSIGLRMPKCVYAGVDEDTGRSLFIMNDLVSEGVKFLSSRSVYTPEFTKAVLGQLALLHARTWGEKNLAGLDWLAANRPSIADIIPVGVLQARVNDGRADGLPDYLRDAERLKEAMRRVTAPQRVCVVHGDPHSLNIYLDREGRPGLLDWQLAHVGHWATDVGYHIATVLDIEDRRRYEECLLRGYLDELARLGQEPPSWEEAWEKYTLYIAYGYFLWCVAQVTPRADIVVHIPRLGTALHDHDTIARLGV